MMNLFLEKRACYSRKKGNGDVHTEFAHRDMTLWETGEDIGIS